MRTDAVMGACVGQSIRHYTYAVMTFPGHEMKNDVNGIDVQNTFACQHLPFVKH